VAARRDRRVAKVERGLKQSAPIVAVGLAIAGLLAWLGWAVTRPDEIEPGRR
jgi:hypothetical protein